MKEEGKTGINIAKRQTEKNHSRNLKLAVSKNLLASFFRIKNGNSKHKIEHEANNF
jgi:hypothetical protein